MVNTTVDFWKMVWATKASSIVMIMKIDELERMPRKCEYYAPVFDSF